MYCLIALVHEAMDAMGPKSPLCKQLLAVKSVVFLTFWQSLALSIYFRLYYIETADDEVPKYAIDLAKNVLMCVEMFFCAIAHW